ncbi:SDR family oxidoreductase [Leucobacter denitrificans]|uniref:SDR family oxidoreductase n=2 Tax=Leucobacter denitrificans TaxID=683042 RepID=A0A7G9S7W6_9MICO|nr:SDR family oxidoreductase [Leucobacter denitrificans]
MSTDFPEMRAVIAGGSSGIGFESARKLASLGTRSFALMSFNQVRLEAARDRLLTEYPDASVSAIQFDAMDPESVQTAIDKAASELGAIDTLIASISAPKFKPELLFRTPITDIPEMLLAQAVGPMLLSRAALDHMREQKSGSIITIASDAAKAATPGETVLGGAMAAIVMFTRSLALEAKRDGIRANSVTPSLLTGTPTTDRALSDGFSKKLFEKAAQLANLGVASAEDQAEIVAFLAGPASERITGQAISANGGISAF